MNAISKLDAPISLQDLWAKRQEILALASAYECKSPDDTVDHLVEKMEEIDGKIDGFPVRSVADLMTTVEMLQVWDQEGRNSLAKCIRSLQDGLRLFPPRDPVRLKSIMADTLNITDLHEQHRDLTAWTYDKAFDNVAEAVRHAVYQQLWNIEDAICALRPSNVAEIAMQLDIIALMVKEDRDAGDHVGEILAGARELAGMESAR